GVVAAPPPFAFENLEVRNRFWRIFGRTIVYQPAFARVARGGFDALVIGHEVKYLTNIVLCLLFRMLRKPVLLWGFGRNPDLLNYRRSALGRALTRLVQLSHTCLLRIATDFMAYTQSGAIHATR